MVRVSIELSISLVADVRRDVDKVFVTTCGNNQQSRLSLGFIINLNHSHNRTTVVHDASAGLPR